MSPQKVQVDEQRFRDLWESGESMSAIAHELNVATFTLNAIRKRLGYPPRTPQNRARARNNYRDPTPEEIKERSAAIRATWSAETEERRRVAKTPGPYQFPMVKVAWIADAATVSE